MDPIVDDILMHYGVKRRSGRYPWGSGENPYQHGGDFLTRVEELEALGKSQKEIAEELKMSIGCVFPRPEEVTMEIKGRCLMTGLPRVFSVSSSEMIEAFEEVSSRILEAIHGVLERTPPELVADISTNGIVMTGGGSLLWGFDKLIESHTGIETHVAEDAISCVAEGTGKSLDSLDQMQDGTMNLSRRKQMNY